MKQAPKFGAVWSMHTLPFQWSADGSRDWEMELKEIYRQGLGKVAAHVTDHSARGESLIDQEREFAIRCNC